MNLNEIFINMNEEVVYRLQDHKILFKNPVGNKAHEDTTYIQNIYMYTCI